MKTSRAGCDRYMQLARCFRDEDLRDVIAFPKVQNMTEPMTACPSPVDDAQLAELSLAIVKEEE